MLVALSISPGVVFSQSESASCLGARQQAKSEAWFVVFQKEISLPGNFPSAPEHLSHDYADPTAKEDVTIGNRFTRIQQLKNTQ